MADLHISLRENKTHTLSSQYVSANIKAMRDKNNLKTKKNIKITILSSHRKKGDCSVKMHSKLFQYKMESKKSTEEKKSSLESRKKI